MSSGRELRGTFDRVAARYHDARPDYPEQLFADLLTVTRLRPPAALLEIGCGTGKATTALARMGFEITAVEVGPALAEQARRRLAAFDRVTVINSAFEQWLPAQNRVFDLIYAACAWKWIDPKVRCERAAALLRPAGHLAVWAADHAYPTGFDPFFTEIQRAYQEIGEAPIPSPPPEPSPEAEVAAEFEASGQFQSVTTRHYLWSCTYAADEYIALLDTFSGHIAMQPAQRDHLYAEIRRLLGERQDGQLTRHWSATLTAGRRK